VSSSFRIALDNYLAELDVAADTVIDVGGSQLPIPKRVKSWAVQKYYIGDLEQPHIDSPKPDFVVDLNNKKNPDVVGYYGLGNVVFCLEVLDYVYDPVNAFKILHQLTAVNGRCIVSSGLFYPTHQPIAEDSLRYTEFGLRRLAEVVGFTVEKVIPRRPETNAIEQLWRAERLRAAKHYDHNALGYIVELRK